MMRIHVSMKFTNEPVKRTPVILYLDTDPEHPIQAVTDRAGVATFDIPPASGKVVINGAGAAGTAIAKLLVRYP